MSSKADIYSSNSRQSSKQLKDIVTFLKRGNRGANASMVFLDASDSPIFGEEELQESAIGFLLNKCRNFSEQSV
jgi:hypothetical protein